MSDTKWERNEEGELVAKLRSYAPNVIVLEAADEIERLRKALSEIADVEFSNGMTVESSPILRIALAALAPQEEL